jgi:phosphatidate cytidylyltransferase
MEDQIFKKLNYSNLFLRIVTALILAPIVIGVTCQGGVFFKAMILIAAILMAYEWNSLTINNPNRQKWSLVGIVYILIPTLSLIWLREQNNGKILVLLLFITVWATDIGAYFCGRLIGGWKIAPSISPNKTWSGLIGGATCAGLVGYVFSNVLVSKYPKTLILLCMSLGVYAQVGDFIESWFKRKFNVKDSGNLLPGHGGILDRVDGIVTTALKLAIAVKIDQWGIF